MVVVFDLIGTLFSLNAVQAVLKERGYPQETLQWWFARLLHTTAAATLSGQYVPFADVAETTLAQIFTVSGTAADDIHPVVSALRNLDPWPDAQTCLERLRERGYRLAVLTNSSIEAAEALLARGGLNFFDEVFSADQVEACKPDPRPYLKAVELLRCRPQEACLVAAHAWDVIGAAAVGMKTVWVERLERKWIFSGGPPGECATSLSDVPERLPGQE